MRHISDVLPQALQHLTQQTQETRPMITIGIDIGLTGAITAIDHNGEASMRDLPVYEEGGSKCIDALALAALLRELVPADRAVMAVIEDIRVRAMSGHPMAHSTENSLAVSRGIVQATLRMARFPCKAVQPPTWKRFYGLIGADKDDALSMARKLYPDLGPMLSRKKDHNRAESLLIAHFAMRTMA